MSYHYRNSKDTLTGIYVVGAGVSAVYCAYKIFRSVYSHRDGPIRNGALSASSAIAGAGLGALWPIVMPGALTWELLEAARNLPREEKGCVVGNGLVGPVPTRIVGCDHIHPDLQGFIRPPVRRRAARPATPVIPQQQPPARPVSPVEMQSLRPLPVQRQPFEPPQIPDSPVECILRGGDDF